MYHETVTAEHTTPYKRTFSIKLGSKSGQLPGATATSTVGRYSSRRARHARATRAAAVAARSRGGRSSCRHHPLSQPSTGIEALEAHHTPTTHYTAHEIS